MKFPNFYVYAIREELRDMEDIPIHKLLNALEQVRGAYDRFPDIFRVGTFIDSTDMKL